MRAMSLTMWRLNLQIQRLRKPLERAIRRGHPWVYREALQRLDASPGDVVVLEDRKGRPLATALAESGPIALRVLTLGASEIDAAFLHGRLQAAIGARP